MSRGWQSRRPVLGMSSARWCSGGNGRQNSGMRNSLCIFAGGFLKKGIFLAEFRILAAQGNP